VRSRREGLPRQRLTVIYFRRLMERIKYDPTVDKLIHVGDLVAKGTKNEEVIQWMIENRIQGVRGNHDHPVNHVTSGGPS
jgi:predicted phosphodiesterase